MCEHQHCCDESSHGDERQPPWDQYEDDDCESRCEDAAEVHRGVVHSDDEAMVIGEDVRELCHARREVHICADADEHGCEYDHWIRDCRRESEEA